MGPRPQLSEPKLFLVTWIILLQFWHNDCNEGSVGYTSKISPERMKFELQELMNIHNARSPEPRPTVEILYKSIVSDIEMEKLVKLDMFVRGLATLNAGDSCNPRKQDILDRAPLTVKFGDPNPNEILDWQRELLLNREPLCNYFNYLQCQADTETCCCKEGLVLRNGACVLELGDNCGTDYYFKSFYFDALKTVKYLVPDPSPSCQLTTSCQKRTLFFRKKCWCDPVGNCDESSMFPPDLDYFRLKTRAEALFSLKLGDECDPELQREIFDPSEYDLTDTKTRIEKLKSILDYPLLKLCNVSRHLNCSEETRRCSCWESLEYQPSTQACHGIRGAPCEQTSLQMEYSPGGPRIWHLEKVFSKNLNTECIDGAECLNVGYGPPGKKCECTNNFGDLCRFPGSIFTQILHEPIRFSSDLCEGEIYNVFDQTNKNMLKLEKEMVLSRNEACRAELEEAQVDTIIKFWNDLSIRWDRSIDIPETVECKDMLLELNDISRKAKRLAEAGFYYCDRTKGLCCGDRTKKCVCLKGTTWQDGRCRIQAGQLCDRWNLLVPKGTPCVLHAKCHPTRDGRRVCKCMSGDPGPLCRPPLHTSTEPYLDPNAISSSTDLGWQWTTGEPSITNDSFITTTYLSTGNWSLPTKRKRLPSLNNGDDIQDRSAPDPNRAAFLNELMEILVEISLDRVVANDTPCQPEHGEAFLNIAKEYSKSNKEEIPLDNVTNLLFPLRTLYEHGYTVCDVQKWLICSEPLEECVCEPKLNRSRGGECAIEPGKDCNITKKVYDLKELYILPDPPCMPGYACMRQPVNTTSKDNYNTICVLLQETSTVSGAQNVFSTVTCASSFPLIFVLIILFN